MHHNLDFIKPGIAVFIAWGVSLTEVTDVIKLISACVALGYGVWKWRKDVNRK